MDTADRVVIQQVVKETLTALGVDPSNPIAVQKDFASLRELRLLAEDPEWQADQAHLRRWRKTMNTVESKGVMLAIKFVIIGMLALVLVGIGVKFDILK